MELGSAEAVDIRKQEEEEEEHFHVLAVDDSVIDMKLLEKLLTISSCKVTCVDSGDKALKYLGLLDDLHIDNASSTSQSQSSSPSSSPHHSRQQQGIKVNMIMTDFCMPGMSGYDLLKRVKGSSWKDVPVVIMSSENIPSRITMCLEGGAEEFLLKPIQSSDLKKLQPYFKKSLNGSCQQQSDESANTSILIDNVNHNNNSINNSIIKRKAMSPEPPERSRLKMKELAVV